VHQKDKGHMEWKELRYHFAMEDLTPEVLRRYQEEYPEHSDNLLTLYTELTTEEEEGRDLTGAEEAEVDAIIADAMGRLSRGSITPGSLQVNPDFDFTLNPETGTITMLNRAAKTVSDRKCSKWFSPVWPIQRNWIAQFVITGIALINAWFAHAFGPSYITVTIACLVIAVSVKLTIEARRKDKTLPRVTVTYSYKNDLTNPKQNEKGSDHEHQVQ
jgi:hypothetical protein